MRRYKFMVGLLALSIGCGSAYSDPKEDLQQPTEHEDLRTAPKNLDKGAAKANTNASFDCAKASSVMEKTVCADRQLAQKDKKLSVTYRAAMASLSSEGKGFLQNAQRQWIRFVQELCADSAVCLSEEYDTRLGQLKKAVEFVDGITIQRIDEFEAKPTNGESDRKFGTLYYSHPRIYSQASKKFELWNKHISETARGFIDDEKTTNNIIDYEILSASRKLISVEFSRYYYNHGSAHGYGGNEVVHWLIDEQRELQLNDIFDKANRKG